MLPTKLISISTQKSPFLLNIIYTFLDGEVENLLHIVSHHYFYNIHNILRHMHCRFERHIIQFVFWCADY